MKKFTELLILIIVIITVNPPLGGAETAKEKFDEAAGYSRAKHYADAEVAFLEVIEKYPKSEWVDNAQLGIGLIYKARCNYTKAIEELRKVATNYPEGDKAPNALFGIGDIYENKLNNAGAALSAYQEVIAKYPLSEFAKMARAKMSNLQNKIKLQKQVKAGGKNGKK